MSIRLGFSPDGLVRTVNRANEKLSNQRFDLELAAIGEIADLTGGFVRLEGNGLASAVPWSGLQATPNSVVLRDAAGAVVASEFIGNAAGLTALNASALTTGTVSAARLPIASYTDATAGTADSKVMSPLRTKNFIQDGNYQIDLGEF